MASKRIQKVHPATTSLVYLRAVVFPLCSDLVLLQELKDLQKDPPTSCSAGECHHLVPLLVMAQAAYCGPSDACTSGKRPSETGFVVDRAKFAR